MLLNSSVPENKVARLPSASSAKNPQVQTDQLFSSSMCATLLHSAIMASGTVIGP